MIPDASASLSWAHPLVTEWFAQNLGIPTEPQEQGWPHIVAGEDTLISSPTGSGKTLAAFLACIDGLVRKSLAGTLESRTEVLYVSPLKALGNDIRKNLETPLAGIAALAASQGLQAPEIRTAVRTGDTSALERRSMLKTPPHILVTTPESLYILLTAEKSRAVLKDVKTVIVDEIHAAAGDKRGAHLALSLERLDALVTTGCRRLPVRIGLSATQQPIELMAQFLGGTARPEPKIVQIGHRRAMDLGVEIPSSELGPVATNEMWDEVYDRVAALARTHRSTLVFVNTRRLVERVSHHLAKRLGEEAVAAHHGSLSRKLRLAAEQKLKAGEAQVLVATASLELGIDIGAVDLVCQIESPRSITVAMQRIGRAGHWHGAIPKGRIFAVTRDDLAECAALVRAIRRGRLDAVRLPTAPLDVLAQQLVAMCACEEWQEDDLYQLVCRAQPYRALERAQFDELLEMLSEGIAPRRGRYGAYLYRDRVNRRVRGRRGSRLVAITSGGAIPDHALYSVIVMPEGTIVGTVDEDFAVESMRGDVMLLGNTSWRIRRVESARGRLLVEDAHGAAPNVPFWRGEAPARTAELSAEVSELREAIGEVLKNGERDLRSLARGQGEPGEREAARAEPGPSLSSVELDRRPGNDAARAAWLQQECALDPSGAGQLVEYIMAGSAILGAIPTQKTVIAERFFDEGGGMQLIIHAPFGGRINRAWGLALRKRFCRSFNFELQAAATDDGLNISLGEQHSFPLADVFRFLNSETVASILEQAVLASPIFETRWRWDANRALAVLRFRNGNKVPPYLQRMRAADLLAAVFPEAAACQENIVGDIHIPHHPLVSEVMKDALSEAMDIDGLKRVLTEIAAGTIECVAVDTPEPSLFSHEILNANPYAYLDDAPLEERRARAVEMRRALPEAALDSLGRLDPEAIRAVREAAWPDARDADELADVLTTFVALPESFLKQRSGFDVWQAYMDSLRSGRRAARALCREAAWWVLAEKRGAFLAVFPDAQLQNDPAELGGDVPSREDAIIEIVRGWISHLGPVTVLELARILQLSRDEVDAALLRLEADGVVLRGRFRLTESTEWCERRLLARIHRMTLGVLRAQIAPVTPSQFLQWLLEWQHVLPGTQAHGERGLLEVIGQLQGFEIPANAWEPHVLARRVVNYQPELLDRLCLAGRIGWGRMSPNPAIRLAEGGDRAPKAGTRRLSPSSVAPITFFVRGEADWMTPRSKSTTRAAERLSHAARAGYEFLAEHGASFFADIVRGTGALKSEVETGLWELVAAGLVTADGFDNLRALIDPKRRAGKGRGRMARPRDSLGRWALLHPGSVDDENRRLESICKLLLARYGVVFRELLARESFEVKWRDLLMTFRRLEDRGEVRGGRFVDGFLGEQFALPLAVESLRAARNARPSGSPVKLSASDPLNLIGIVLPGDRVPPLARTEIVWRNGTLAAMPVMSDSRRAQPPLVTAASPMPL